ncbi:hypothetical protein M758_8G194000 [Ceratodon purpureus]|uniref:Uncharacterized protein n=1 Tax=Ceratodon purpureus TaxID=3225 RepID=A0A8T0H584_CERPU|nr:hypothetical protein KC19_8G199100 [Ceratodon purpureus]KAG0609565.1 hypothetical protein M758_8G194000 [Ceratodon purpureus]
MPWSPHCILLSGTRWCTVQYSTVQGCFTYQKRMSGLQAGHGLLQTRGSRREQGMSMGFFWFDLPVCTLPNSISTSCKCGIFAIRFDLFNLVKSLRVKHGRWRMREIMIC